MQKVLKTRGFVSNPMGTISMAAFCGLLLMSVSVMVGAHVFVSMGALLAGILGIYGIKAGHMEYLLTSDSLERRFQPFLAQCMGLQGQRQVFAFEDIVSYKQEEDLSRSMRERSFLNITLRRRPYTIWITDEQNPAVFRDFAEAFIQHVEQFNSKAAATGPLASCHKADHRIRRQPSFYRSLGAKILTLIFILLNLGLMVAFFTGIGSIDSLIRWAGIILPGTFYMVWRVFVQK